MFSSCVNQNDTFYNMSISYQGESFKIENQSDLKDFTYRVLSKDDAFITKSEFQLFKDDKGEFHAIVAKYNYKEAKSLDFVISLNQHASSNLRVAEFEDYFEVGCSMTCDASFCSSCGMTIHEECKRITCSCSKPNDPAMASCSPKIHID